jgi:homoserine dehydrogenase
MAFTLSATTASVCVLGATGRIGGELLKQLQAQQNMLKDDLGLDMRVTIAASSTVMVSPDVMQKTGAVLLRSNCAVLLAVFPLHRGVHQRSWARTAEH